MSHRRLWVVLMLLVCSDRSGLKAAVRADIPRKVVESGKRATVLVETREATGTAFCIDAAGDFITNQHVVGNNTRVTLVLNSGEADQKMVAARVVESDPALDIALLTVEKPGTYTPLPLAQNNDDLIETTPIAAFGFPYGKDLAVGGAQYPSISVSTGRVTALRKNRGLLMEIQVDAAVTSGSSGGPLLDEKGRVIGIIAKGFKDVGIRFAIPIGYLQTMLHTPHITVVSPGIPRAKMSLPNVVQFRVATLSRRHTPYDVTFTRFPHTDQEHTMPVPYVGDETYAVTTVPLPATAPPDPLRLTVSSAKGSFVATTTDREITIHDRKLRLRELSWITGGSPPSVRLRGGAALLGPVVGIRDLPVVIQGVQAKLNIAPGQTVLVEEMGNSPALFYYELVVRQDGKVVATLRENLPIDPIVGLQIGEKAPFAPAVPQAGGQSNGPIGFWDPIVLTVPGMKGFTGLCLADLDHDGHLDILVTVGTDLVVLYGHGDGKTFETMRYPMGVAGSHICVADLNHDGRADVMIVGGGGVQVLLNTGPRQFAAPQSYPTGEGASSVTVGDFNGDGSPDLAVTNMGSANFAVLLNRGDGTFRPATLTPTGQYPMSIAAADMHRDKKIDLLVNCFYSSETLRFEGDGQGGFRRAGVIPDTGGGQLILADLNADGHPDLAGLNYWNSGLGIRWGVDTKVFGTQRIATKKYPSQIAVGDLDGDGRLDLIFGNQGTNMFTVCLNGGDGTMQDGLTFTVPGEDVHSAVIGDLNEDGNSDVVADGGADRLFLLLNRAPPIPNRKGRN